jgi:hypothetical protein
MTNRTFLAVVLSILVLLSAGGSMLYKHTRETEPRTQPDAAEGDDLAPPRTPPAGMKEYRNTRFRFALFYPEAMTVQSYSEGGSAMTFTFTEAGKAFQVFVVRYREPQVTEERFRMDNPSGVQKDLKNVTIDGVSAAAFYSENAAVGETAEVWFVHGDYLYEVTAPKALAGRLSDIMQSWMFL